MIMKERKPSEIKRLNHCVIDDVVKHNLCIGCGICAAVCPKNKLSIVKDNFGCFIASNKGQQCDEWCGLCMKCCPSANPHENAIANNLFSSFDNAKMIPDVGFVVSSWIGHVVNQEERLSSSSGGLATWFLKEILRQGIVDKVVCVENVSRNGSFYEYKICSSEEEFNLTTRSAYYPVEMSKIIQSIVECDGEYAITCLPCFAKGLRLACERIPVLRNRIKYIVGLVCGHTVSSFFAEFAASCAECNNGNPTKVTFRTKDSRFPATELGTECSWDDGLNEIKKTVFWSDGLAEAWCNHWFTPNPCFYCDDVFAETADIVFMDAWLPEYENDYRGNSIAITRTDIADGIINNGISSNQLSLNRCSINDVIASQSAVIKNKHDGLAHRLWINQNNGKTVLQKRVLPKRSNNAEQAKIWEAQLQASSCGLNLWRKGLNVKRFQQKMRNICGWETVPQDHKSVLKVIKRIIRKFLFR